MFNIKWGIIAGITALVLAFATSLLSGHVSLLISALRAAGFAVLFFFLATGAWSLINHFIPELLIPESAKESSADVFTGEPSGKRVNITLGDAADAALPGKDGNEHNIDDVENIGDLISGKLKPARQHIDQSPAASYNDEAGGFTPFSESLAAADSGGGDFSMDFGSFISGGEMGELEPLSDSFQSDPVGSVSEPDDSFLPERKVSRNKPVKIQGDFNPKEIASGIRTVLQKDKG